MGNAEYMGTPRLCCNNQSMSATSDPTMQEILDQVKNAIDAPDPRDDKIQELQDENARLVRRIQDLEATINALEQEKRDSTKRLGAILDTIQTCRRPSKKPCVVTGSNNSPPPSQPLAQQHAVHEVSANVTEAGNEEILRAVQTQMDFMWSHIECLTTLFFHPNSTRMVYHHLLTVAKDENGHFQLSSRDPSMNVRHVSGEDTARLLYADPTLCMVVVTGIRQRHTEAGMRQTLHDAGVYPVTGAVLSKMSDTALQEAYKKSPHDYNFVFVELMNASDGAFKQRCDASGRYHEMAMSQDMVEVLMAQAEEDADFRDMSDDDDGDLEDPDRVMQVDSTDPEPVPASQPPNQMQPGAVKQESPSQSPAPPGIPAVVTQSTPLEKARDKFLEMIPHLPGPTHCSPEVTQKREFGDALQAYLEVVYSETPHLFTGYFRVKAQKDNCVNPKRAYMFDCETFTKLDPTHFAKTLFELVTTPGVDKWWCDKTFCVAVKLYPGNREKKFFIANKKVRLLPNQPKVETLNCEYEDDTPAIKHLYIDKNGVIQDQ